MGVELVKNASVKRCRPLTILIFFISVFVVLSVIFIVSGYLYKDNLVSFLPDYDPPVTKSKHDLKNGISLHNSWYKLNIDETGFVTVSTSKGELIMSGLRYYSVFEDGIVSHNLHNVTLSLLNDSTISVRGNSSGDVSIQLLFVVHEDNPRLDVSVKTQYNSNVTVYRETLIARFEQSPIEVYLKNRKIVTKRFSLEYWLDKQGVRFGKGKGSALIFHTPGVSSLQLKSKNRLLFINLELYADHPLMRIPVDMDLQGNWIDLSTAAYNEGSQRDNFFSIWFGNIPEIIPRLMLVPDGYLAGYIFTEHADNGNIRTHRAAYFGSDKISKSENATGGFVGHKIPVTKSVFYADSTAKISGGSVRDDPDYPQFLEFLDDLYSSGNYDICLHSPEGYSSNRETLEEAIRFMRERYKTETWIDHGVLPGIINREAFFCEGLDKNSDLYAADLWEKYGTRFFWSPAVETLQKKLRPSEELHKLRFANVSSVLWLRFLYLCTYQDNTVLSSLLKLLKGYFPMNEQNSLQQLKGSAYPTPLYWQNITRSGQFYSWPTEFVYKGISPENLEYQMKNEEIQLNRLISDQGVFFNHGYYVRLGKNNYILNEKDGEIIINPSFDRVLGLISGMRDMGDLHITTVKDLLNYRIKSDSIIFDYCPDGSVYICNNGKEKIKGLSLILCTDSENITISGNKPPFRRSGEDTIIWFDIDGGEKLKLELGDDKLNR